MNPRRVRIKFCGMTREQDIETAVELGVDAVGLILVEGSPRRLSLQRACQLRAMVPPMVACVALLRDAEQALLRQVVEELAPDLLQFHGTESAAYCAGAGCRYLKAIPMAEPEIGLAMLDAHFGATGFVFDSHRVDGLGGSGKVFDWTRIPARARRRAILAGGLDPDNVAAAVRAVRPYAVDVASGIECAPGIKDPARMRAFVDAVRSAESGPFAEGDSV